MKVMRETYFLAYTFILFRFLFYLSLALYFTVLTLFSFFFAFVCFYLFRACLRRSFPDILQWWGPIRPKLGSKLVKNADLMLPQSFATNYYFSSLCRVLLFDPLNNLNQDNLSLKLKEIIHDVPNVRIASVFANC